MRRFLFPLLTCLIGLVLVPMTPDRAPACAYGMAGPLEQFLACDFIVVGKVKAVEDCVAIDPPTSAAPQVQMHNYRVAIISITESLKGAQGLSAIRVGFSPGSEPKVGAEGCFYLSATTYSFSTLAGGYLFPMFREGNPNFDQQVQTARQLAKVWDDPRAALRSKNDAERLLAVGLLLNHYKGQNRYDDPAKVAFAPIDREESKMILEALATADWSKPGLLRQSAPRLFRMLGPQEKDGWSPRADANFEQAAKTWLKSHAEKYRILAVVARG